MLQKTRGIVFRFTKYGESSIIVNVFTEAFGLQSYIVNGARSRSSRNAIALYQPLTLLDLVVYHKENASILRIKEARCAYHYSTLFSDIRKSTQALFLTEIINKSVKDQSHAHEICSFLFDSFELLDRQTGGYENFHLIFLMKLSRFLGFGTEDVTELLSGRIVDAADASMLQRLVRSDYLQPVMMTQQQRRNLLDILLRFYSVHVGSLGEVKSVDVLRDVLS